MTKPENEIVVVDAGGIEQVTWALPPMAEPDLSLVDDLARLALSARRLGYTLRLRNPGGRVAEMLDLAGLRVEVLGQAEGGEQVGVEEVVMPDDPIT